MVRHLHAVQYSPDTELLEVVQDLLDDIKKGKVRGLAFVALENGTGYSADVLGTVHDHPLMTLGLCRALEDAVVIKTRK